MLGFFFKRIIFHIIYLYYTPFCPFSDKRLDLFPGFIKLLLHLNEREMQSRATRVTVLRTAALMILKLVTPLELLEDRIRDSNE